MTLSARRIMLASGYRGTVALEYEQARTPAWLARNTSIAKYWPR